MMAALRYGSYDYGFYCCSPSHSLLQMQIQKVMGLVYEIETGWGDGTGGQLQVQFQPVGWKGCVIHFISPTVELIWNSEKIFLL